MAWDPKQYELFLRERTQPSRDLASRAADWLHAPVSTALDIGCGPGNSTAVVAAAFPGCQVTGLDSSAEMVARAREKHPELAFEAFDATQADAYRRSPVDLVFSNACIQWIPDHGALFPRLFSLLKPGGVLAIQTPLQAIHPMHRLIASVATSERWQLEARSFHNLTIEGYHDLLATLTDEFTLWETVYLHRMPSHESIVEWYKGSGLRPYLAALSPEAAADFEAEILSGVRQLYPVQQNGEIIFAFPRLFLLARKAA